MNGPNGLRLGCATAAAVGLLVLGLLGWGVVRQSQRRAVEVRVYLGESSAGLYPGSAVRLRGVTLGEVREIGVASDRRLIEVRCALWWDALVEQGLVDPDDVRQPEQGPFAPPGFYAYLAEVGITDLRLLTLEFFPIDRVEVYPVPDDAPWAHIPAVKSSYQTLKEFVETRFAYAGPGLQSAAEQVEALELETRELNGADLHTRISNQLDDLEQLFEGRAAGELIGEKLGEARDGLAQVRAGIAEVDSALTHGSPQARKRVDALLERLDEADLQTQLADARAGLVEQQVNAQQLREAAAEVRAAVRAARDWLRDFEGVIDGYATDRDGLLVSPAPPERP